MFRTAQNKEIGKYLDALIHKKFKSARQFGIQYLNYKNPESNNDDEIQKMQNRLHQLKIGKNSVQIDDLPIFAELLNVSIEEILSAGDFVVANPNRVTNYSIAFSKDPKKWEAYINREDKLFLNPDEYNKTIIDYAIEAQNYGLLKYLMDKNYIWFIGQNKKEYFLGFGAGTSIKRRDIGYTDPLNVEMKRRDELRFGVIAVALKNKEVDILERLHAREIPILYTIDYPIGYMVKDEKLQTSENLAKMIKSIASCKDNKVISYFFEPFEIEDIRFSHKNKYIFPFAGMLLDAMIRNDKLDVWLFIDKTIKYNKATHKKLLDYINNGLEEGKKYYMETIRCNEDIYEKLHKAKVEKAISEEYYYNSKTGFIAFWETSFCPYDSRPGFITNVIRVTAKSSKPEIQEKIDELNKIYDSFFKPIYKEI